jgi:translation initiation factor 1
MAKKKKKIKTGDEGGIVYSTNSNFAFADLLSNALDNAGDSSEDVLEVHFEKKGRAGKTAIVVKGFKGSEDELKELGKTVKTKCGVGGSVKDGEIIIQGNVRDKVVDVLRSEGYKTKNVGG